MAEPAPPSRAVSPATTNPATPMAARLLLAGVSIGVALLIAEVGLRLILPSAPAATGETRPGFITHDPELGWRPVPGGRGTMHGEEFDVEVEINAQGIRGPRAYDRARQPGVPRIVVVGDSYSFGYGVTHAENWITRIEDALAPAEVINLAVTGYGTDQQLLRLERVGLDWQPDLVVLALFEGNVFRNARFEQVGYPKPRFVLDGDDLTLTGVPVPESPPAPGWTDRSALGRLVFGRGGEFFEHLGYGEAWPVTRAIVDRMRAATEAAGAELAVLVIPKDQAVHGSGLRKSIHERTLAKIDDLLGNAGIASAHRLDLTSALAAAGATERLYFWTDGHWNPRGHAIAAEAAAAFLAPRIEAFRL